RDLRRGPWTLPWRGWSTDSSASCGRAATTAPGSGAMTDDRAHELLGIRVHALDIDGLHARIDAAVRANRREVIAHHNLHSAYLVRRSEPMRRFYAGADWTHIDGMP